MNLYDKPIRGANRLPVEDLRQIARFNRIVMDYIKIKKINTKPFPGNSPVQRLTNHSK